MARGDMRVENATFGSGAEILNRPPFSGVSMTIDFDGATENAKYKADKGTGELYVPAGMPIGKDGKPVEATPFTGAVGILLVDVYQHRPQGTVVTEGYINVKRAKANSGVAYDAALVAAMVNAGNRIRFEETDTGNDVLIGELSGSGE